MKITKIIFLLLTICSGTVFAFESDDFSINASPRGIIPLGESRDLFNFGYGAAISLDYKLPVTFPIFARLGIDYEYIPIITNDGVSALSLSVGPGFRYSPAKNLMLSAYGTGGFYIGTITSEDNKPAGFLSLAAGASVQYKLTPAVGVLLSGDYVYKPRLLSGIGLTVGTVIHPKGFASKVTPQYGNSIDLLESLSPGVSGGGLDVKQISFNQVFPVLFKHYDSSPIGNVKLYNNEETAITNVSLSLYVDRYMDNPKQSPVIDSVQSGESIDFDIYALFSDSVLDITEGTKVSANVILKYTYNNEETSRKYVVSMDMFDRNAITWDDDRKAAAFVTAKDPAVLELAKNVSGWVKQVSPAIIDRNLCIAMGLHNSLNIYGLNYQIDPKTPFSEFSKDTMSIDFLQFPRQTLSYSSGDCDDLSILYSALMESVGIETAFITVPGHIFMAFALNMSPSESKRTILNQEDLIFFKNKAWVPVEVTLVQENFLEAWSAGAKQWRQYYPSGKAFFYPMHDSWEEYKPVGLPGSTALSIPDKPEVLEVYQAELQRFIDREIYPRVQRFEKQIQETNNEPKYVNRLGVLYAKYGLNDKAEVEFTRVLRFEEYVPSLINLGNLKYLEKKTETALEYYERALLVEPENPKIHISIACANYSLENYETVNSSYEFVKTADPELAERFAYLQLPDDNDARASNTAQNMEVVVWDED